MLTVFKYLIENRKKKVVFINLCDGGYFAKHQQLMNTYLNGNLPGFKKGKVRIVKGPEDKKGNLRFIEAQYNDEIEPKQLDGKIVPFEIEQLGFL